jgi:hypothetical protein
MPNAAHGATIDAVKFERRSRFAVQSFKRRLKSDEISLLADVIARHRPDLVSSTLASELDEWSADQRHAIYEALVDELLTRGIEDGEVNEHGLLVEDLIDALFERDRDAEQPEWLRAVRPSDADIVVELVERSDSRDRVVGIVRVFATNLAFELTKGRYIDYVRTHGGRWQVDDERSSVRLHLDNHTIAIEPWRSELEAAPGYKQLRRGSLRALRRGVGSYLEVEVDPPA